MINNELSFREKLKQAYGSVADAASEVPDDAARPVVTLTPDQVRQAEQEQERVRGREKSAR